jgi:hypothetical protein
MIRSSLKRNSAESFLREALASGPIRPADLFSRAANAGINRHILELVKKTHSKAVQKSDGWWIHSIADDATPPAQLLLFHSPTLPNWLTASEIIWWAKSNSTTSGNHDIQSVAKAAEIIREDSLEEGFQAGFENAIELLEEFLDELVRDGSETDVRRLLSCIKGEIESIKDQCLGPLSTE